MTEPTSVTIPLAVLKPFLDCLEQIDPAESDEEWAKFRLLIGDYRRLVEAVGEAPEQGQASPPNWTRCPSTHCERAQECRSPHECSGAGKQVRLEALLGREPT